jgi:hypothetical protein
MASEFEGAVPVFSIILSIALQAGPGPAPEGKLRCYEVMNSIGIVAVREFSDAAGHVEKQIFYDSMALGDGPGIGCAPGTLRVRETRTYVRDSEGRAIVEKRYARDGRLQLNWTIVYHGPGRDAYTRTSFGPSGELWSQLRHGTRSHTELVFDKDRRVAAVNGQLPGDVEYSVGWGQVVDGWSCGLGLPATTTAAGDGRIVVHLRNHTDMDRSIWITQAFETDLHDEAGKLVPLTADYVALTPTLALTSRTGIGVVGGGAAFLFAVDLDRRYGELRPGRYTVTVRHRHPETAATLVSNTLAFELPFK